MSKERAFVCRTPPKPWAPPPPPRPTTDGPFEFIAAPLPWPQAEADCVRRGGHLASIHSNAENDAIRALCHPDECWIGFNDVVPC